MPIDPDLTLDEIMRRWPASIRVFIRHRMLCIGCPIAAFHTAADACREHDVPLEAFLAEIEAVLPDGPSPSAARRGAGGDAAP